MRQQFAKSSLEIAEKDPQMMMLIGDISHHLLRDFEGRFPNKFMNAGICEQALVGMASGMAIGGMRPIVHTIAPFCVERAFEQIKIDLCYQNVDVTIISVGSSFDYASLGCTHHCYEDVAILRSLPRMQVFVPGSSKEFDHMLKSTWGNGSPKYFKLSTREHNIDTICEPFKVSVVKSSANSKGTVIVNGHLLQDVCDVENVDVIYTSTLSSLDDESKLILRESVARTGRIVTIEENSVVGGLADLVSDSIFDNSNINLKSFQRIGIPRQFLTNYGTADEHRKSLGLTRDALVSKIRKACGE